MHALTTHVHLENVVIHTIATGLLGRGFGGQVVSVSLSSHPTLSSLLSFIYFVVNSFENPFVSFVQLPFLQSLFFGIE